MSTTCRWQSECFATELVSFSDFTKIDISEDGRHPSSHPQLDTS